MKKEKITIEDLARMVQKGFLETTKKDEVNVRFEEVNRRFLKVDDRFAEVNLNFKKIGQRFDKVDNRLERIEKLLITDHRRRIEKLELEVKELRELLAVK